MAPIVETTTQQQTSVNNTPQASVKTTRTTIPEHVVGEQPQQAYQTKKAIFRSYQVIWYILGIIEVLLAFRVILLMLGANQNSGFVDLIYTVSSPFALPFAGMFGVTYPLEGSIIEWSTYVAMIVYLIVAYGLIKLMQLVKPVDHNEVENAVDQKSSEV